MNKREWKRIKNNKSLLRRYLIICTVCVLIGIPIWIYFDKKTAAAYAIFLILLLTLKEMFMNKFLD